MGRVEEAREGWIEIEEDGGEHSIVQVSKICYASGDDEGFSISFVNGDDMSYVMKGGYTKLCRILADVEAPVDTETFGRVPV